MKTLLQILNPKPLEEFLNRGPQHGTQYTPILVVDSLQKEPTLWTLWKPGKTTSFHAISIPYSVQFSIIEVIS